VFISGLALVFISEYECVSAVEENSLTRGRPPQSPRPFSPGQSPGGERGPSGVQAAVNGGNLVDDVTPPRRRLAAVALDGVDGVDKIDRIDSGPD
jgi:hypothetical protein